eukprot:232571-Prymnesium_polylepis.1
MEVEAQVAPFLRFGPAVLCLDSGSQKVQRPFLSDKVSIKHNPQIQIKPYSCISRTILSAHLNTRRIWIGRRAPDRLVMCLGGPKE